MYSSTFLPSFPATTVRSLGCSNSGPEYHHSTRASPPFEISAFQYGSKFICQQICQNQRITVFKMLDKNDYHPSPRFSLRHLVANCLSGRGGVTSPFIIMPSGTSSQTNCTYDLHSAILAADNDFFLIKTISPAVSS